jgi:pyruvate dehydrogenase E2 component (dihydrolipoamide acetyltransferase)
MPRSFKLPDLGEGIHEGEVLAVLVSEGDQVKEGAPILEVETDKAAVEIPSPYDGTVKEILVKPGDTVQVGDVLMTFSGGEEEKGVREERPRAEPTPPQKPAVREAEAVPGGPPAKEMKPTAPPEEGEVPPPGAPGEPEKEEPPAPRKEGPVPASPSTRRIARELGVDLRRVEASGPGGRVTSEDVKAFAEGKGVEKKEEPPRKREEKKTPEPAEGRPLTIPEPELPDFGKWGPIERAPLRSIRRATARQMTVAWSHIPHVNSLGEVDITLLETFRKKHKEEVREKGGSLSLTVFALKAAAAALKAHPRFNATLDMERGEMVLKKYYHIGVAVDTEEGLIVPVVRDVDRKSITDLSVELKDLVERTRDRKVSLEEMRGGTFTITNIGPMGGGHFAPIINYPEVAILGMGSARWQPVVKEKGLQGHEIVARLILPIVLCIDHRILDGSDAMKFMHLFREALEDPEVLLMTIS